MDLTQLLQTMRDDIASLDIGQKAVGGLVVTLLCMVIVFMVLIVLMFIVKAMRIARKEKGNQEGDTPAVKAEALVSLPSAIISEDDDEIAAVIAAALAAAGGGASGLIVRNITRVPDQSTQWSKTYLSYKEDI
ncbi:MAG: OadG family protein [Clostridiales bacterium]|jgi:sodium pump decarboxylase gamma subunit|nr:OadG family protein [Clostridiales bacterium]